MPPTDTRIKIPENSEGAIKMVKTPLCSRRTRPMNVKHHTNRDTIDKGIVQVQYVRSGE